MNAWRRGARRYARNAELRAGDAQGLQEVRACLLNDQAGEAFALLRPFAFRAPQASLSLRYNVALLISSRAAASAMFPLV